MFLAMALAFALAGAVHGHLVSRSDPPSATRRRVELALVWLVAGYFGAVMVAVALFMLFVPERAAAFLDAEPGNPFQEFAGVLYLSMALMAVLAAWFRGAYLLAPVFTWAFYFLAATLVHLGQYHHGGDLGVHSGVAIVAEHALPALLAVGLALRLWALERRSGRSEGDL